MSSKNKYILHVYNTFISIVLSHTTSHLSRWHCEKDITYHSHWSGKDWVLVWLNGLFKTWKYTHIYSSIDSTPLYNYLNSYKVPGTAETPRTQQRRKQRPSLHDVYVPWYVEWILERQGVGIGTHSMSETLRKLWSKKAHRPLENSQIVVLLLLRLEKFEFEIVSGHSEASEYSV